MDGGDVQYVVALDKATGKTRWKTDRSLDLARKPADVRKGFDTPTLAKIDDTDLVISTGADATYGYDPKSGREVWRFRHGGFSMTSRILASDGLLYVNTGFMRPRLISVRATGSGDVTEKGAAWTQRSSVPTMSSPVVVDGMLFMVSDSGTASCLDAKTGERHWRKKIGGTFSASPLATEDRVYFFSRDGDVIVVAAEKAYRELARNRFEEGFMASPAVVGDTVILRSKKALYRVESSER
jgi:outer membrane protein assembly factor BamB